MLAVSLSFLCYYMLFIILALTYCSRHINNEALNYIFIEKEITWLYISCISDIINDRKPNSGQCCKCFGRSDWRMGIPANLPIVTDTAYNTTFVAKKASLTLYTGYFAHTLNLACWRALRMKVFQNFLQECGKSVFFIAPFLLKTKVFDIQCMVCLSKYLS